jgi:hypothetical protein
MMKARSWILTAVLAVVLPRFGYGADLQGKFTIAAEVGTQSEVAGNLMQSAQGTLFDQPINITSASYRDVFGPDWRFQGLIGYGVTSRSELIGKVTYYKATGRTVEAGQYAGSDLLAVFDTNDYEEIGVEVGYRYYLATRTRLKSYIAPTVGARFIQKDILVTFASQNAGTSISNIPFSQKGTVPVFGLDIGFTVDIGENLYVGVDTGLRYQSAMKQFNYLLGLTQIDDSEGRWSAPVVAVVGVRF